MTSPRPVSTEFTTVANDDTLPGFWKDIPQKIEYVEKNHIPPLPGISVVDFHNRYKGASACCKTCRHHVRHQCRHIYLQILGDDCNRLHSMNI